MIPDSTRGTYSGQDSALWRQWLKERGVKMVFIDPFTTTPTPRWGASGSPREWGPTPPWPMAIAHVWITEGTYDKGYVEDRTVGFDEFKKYVLGEVDGQPKTPEWAAAESGSRPAPSSLWPGSGPPSAPSFRAARAAEKAEPAARPTAPNGPG